MCILCGADRLRALYACSAWWSVVRSTDRSLIINCLFECSLLVVPAYALMSPLRLPCSSNRACTLVRLHCTILYIGLASLASPLVARGVGTGHALSSPLIARPPTPYPIPHSHPMSTITIKDGVSVFFRSHMHNAQLATRDTSSRQTASSKHCVENLLQRIKQLTACVHVCVYSTYICSMVHVCG